MDFKRFEDEVDVKEMGLVERVSYASYLAHSSFEQACEYLDSGLMQKAECELYEAIDMIRTVRDKIEISEQIDELKQLEELLTADYRVFE